MQSLTPLQQDYLSKPLRQNQLIQTILRCATLGGHLYDHEKHAPTMPDINLPADSPASTPKKRPALDQRGFTERGQAAQSPSLLAADQTDENVERVRSMSYAL
jgi:osomolarity two-component system sensor histidine kinase NIK1